MNPTKISRVAWREFASSVLTKGFIIGALRTPVLIIVMISLVAVQAVINLTSDWNLAPEHHSPADDVDEEELAAIKRSVGSE